jgi:hypothetical protein
MSTTPAYDFWLDAQSLLDTPTADPAAQDPSLLAAAAVGQSAGSTALAGIRSEYGFTGVGQTVAVIDTGIAWDTAALGGGFGAGYRVVGGWDFAENDANPFDDGPAGGHGTHVSGIIGSSDTRYTGAAPGVDLVSLRVFDDNGGGTFGWIEQALRWVHEHRTSFANPITTVNISIGTNWNAASIPAWATLEDEFAQLKSDGIFIAVAAGNSFTSYNTQGVSYPAASQYVVPVASTDADGQLSYFSQRNDRVLAAPGRLVTSSVPDYIGNRNGRNDDFAAMSGTSMAAPYVAGAAVLVRQAFAFVGQENVGQDDIYNLLRNTADTVFDAVTGATYRRLNIDRAIDTLMPINAHGSAATARDLGTVIDTFSTSDLLARRTDRDYYSFTAARSGKLTVTLSTADEMRADWHLADGSSYVDASGLTFTFDVVAGQKYTFDLGTSAAIGHYELTASLATAMPDWGTIELATLADQTVGAGHDSFAFNAARDGYFTIEALAGAATAGISFDLYDAAGRLLGTSAAVIDGGLRLDAIVSAGQSLVLRVHGSSSDVDFRLTNLLTRTGNSLTVFGTAGDDTFSAVAGSRHQLAVNGVTYEFDAATITSVSFVGRGGNDRVSFTTTGTGNTATLRDGSVELVGAGYRFAATDVASIEVNSLGGAGDRAVLYDSSGADTLVATPNSARLTGEGLDNSVTGFRAVQAFASGGGDVARLYDSAGSDLLEMRAASARLSGAGYDNLATGFASVIAYSSAGQDQASFYAAATGDAFSAGTDRAELTAGGYTRQALGFNRVVAFASGRANVATLYGSAGNDTLNARPDTVQLRGAGFETTVRGFSLVQASGGGGQDEAYLYGTGSKNLFVAIADTARFSGDGFRYAVRDFRTVRAFATQPDSVALMYYQPSAGDTTQSSPQQSMSRAGYDYATYNFGHASTVALARVQNTSDTATVAATSKPVGAAQQAGSSETATTVVASPQLRGAPTNAAQLTRARMSAIDAIFRIAGDAAAVTGPQSFTAPKR